MNITLRNIPPRICLTDILGELRATYGITFRCVDGQVVGTFSDAKSTRLFMDSRLVRHEGRA